MVFIMCYLVINLPIFVFNFLPNFGFYKTLQLTFLRLRGSGQQHVNCKETLLDCFLYLVRSDRSVTRLSVYQIHELMQSNYSSPINVSMVIVNFMLKDVDSTL